MSLRDSTAIKLSYAEWETKIGSNPVFFVQSTDIDGNTTYVAITGDNNNQYHTTIIQTADITDFETDHKPGGTAVNSLEDGVSRLVGPKNVITSVELIEAIAAGNGYVASNQKVLTGTSVPWVLLRNPSGSGKKLLLVQAILSLDEPQAKRIEIEIYEKPVVTGAGTLVTARNKLIGSSNTTVMEFRFDPTVSANGNLINEFDFTANVPLFLDFQGSIQIKPNNDILVRSRAPNGNTTSRINFSWVEVIDV